MTTELGVDAERDQKLESKEHVVEVTPEEVDTVGGPADDSSIETADAPAAKQTKPDEPAADRASRGETDAPRADDQPPRDESSKTVYCVRCGSDMRLDDRFCRNCGWDSSYTSVSAPPTPRQRAPLPPNTSERNRLTALLLCVLLGWVGAHRFYLGKIGTGILWLVTLGFLGIGVLFDLVMIATGECRDIDGKPVLRWD